jgi:hypothetical protein
MQPGEPFAVFVVSAEGGQPKRISGPAPAFNSHWMPNG